MNTKAGKTFGLALIMAVGILAIMFALGTFSSQKAGAHDGAATHDDGAHTIAHDDVDLNVRNLEAGANRQVVVEFMDSMARPVGTTISIKLASFGVTGPIAPESVTISSNDAGNDLTAHPSDVTVSGTTITLEVPDMDSDDGAQGIAGGAMTTIRFQASADITLPTVAGDYAAEVDDAEGMFVKGVETVGLPDADPAVAEVIGANGVTIEKTLKLSPTSGARGTEVTATGKGFLKDINALFIDTDQNGMMGSTEVNIASSISVSKGSFTHKFTVGDGFAAGANYINARDIAGDAYRDSMDDDGWPTFTVKGGISLDKTSVKLGEKFKISLKDFGNGAVTEAKIGSASVLPSTAPNVSGNKVTFEVTVPPSGVAIGKQQVSVKVGDESAAASILIEGLPLTVSPTSAVPGQEITIRGSGFSKGAALMQVKVDGWMVTLQANAQPVTSVLVNNAGTFVFSVIVPPTATGEGDDILVEVQERGPEGEPQGAGNSRIGVVKMTIPAETLTLDPAESRPGTVVTASGTGFVARENVSITYGGGNTLVSVSADSAGMWTAAFTVPITSEVGTTSAVGATGSGGTKSKSADHKTPGASISVSPDAGRPGTLITVTGTGFKAFSPVVRMSIGGLTIPSGGVNTDENGNFETTATLPALAVGTQSLVVGVGGTVAQPNNQDSVVFTVTTADAPTVVTATDVVFKALIDADNLERVYHYVNATGEWLVYDPRPDFAEFNNYTESTGGQAVWVKVTNAAQFQGEPLFAGWNLIVLQ